MHSIMNKFSCSERDAISALLRGWQRPAGQVTTGVAYGKAPRLFGVFATMSNTTILGPPRLLTAQELAHLLNISLRQLWRLRAASELPTPVRVGQRSVRWRYADVVRFVDRLRPQPSISSAAAVNDSP